MLSLLIAHPDDESWAFASLLSHAKTQGWPVRILCLTSGDAGVDRRLYRADASPLADARERELCAAMKHLDTEVSVDFARLPDAALQAHTSEALRAFQTWWSPDSLVTATWGPSGGYGHRDHVVCYGISKKFFKEIDTPVLTAHFPWASAHEVYRTLRRYRGGALVIDDFTIARNHEVSRFALDVDKSMKIQMLKEHVSQVGDDEAARFVHADLTGELAQHEHFDLLYASQYESAARVLHAADNVMR